MAETSNDEPKPLTKPFKVDDVPWEEFTKGKFGSRFKALSAFGGGSRIGVAVEELAPGMRSNVFHFHMKEEEQVWILEGRVTLRLGEHRYEMKAGDYVVFPAGQRAGHCFINESDSVVKWMIVGENKPDEVCVYPDSDKTSVRLLREIYDRGTLMDYWDRERTEEA